jgi:hypothetical protein
MLHEHLAEARLPRWFNEGICQWASDGIGEIMINERRSRLNRAAFHDAFIPLRALEDAFPQRKGDFVLAYEESKSFVTYLIRRFGKERLLDVLALMREGVSMENAFVLALGISPEDMEGEWQRTLKRKMSWLTLLSYHLYDLLFVFAAVFAIAGCIRFLFKKRAYMREQKDSEHEQHP